MLLHWSGQTHGKFGDCVLETQVVLCFCGQATFHGKFEQRMEGALLSLSEVL